MALSLLLLLMSLAVHELGHWMLLTRFKVNVTEYWVGVGIRIFKFRKLNIGLFPIGASLHPDIQAFNALPASSRLAIALAGPAASALYAATLYLASFSLAGDAAVTSLQTLAYLNLLIALFNLFPIPPLDGWVAFSSLVEHLGRPLRASSHAIAGRVGNGVIYGIGFFVLWGLLRLWLQS